MPCGSTTHNDSDAAGGPASTRSARSTPRRASVSACASAAGSTFLSVLGPQTIDRASHPAHPLSNRTASNGSAQRVSSTRRFRRPLRFGVSCVPDMRGQPRDYACGAGGGLYGGAGGGAGYGGGGWWGAETVGNPYSNPCVPGGAAGCPFAFTANAR